MIHVRDAEDSGKLAKGLALLDEKVRPLGFVAVILFHTPRHHYEDVANNCYPTCLVSCLLATSRGAARVQANQIPRAEGVG